MKTLKKLLVAAAAALLVSPAAQVSAAPPAYFVDEAKLPFTALPGAQALWGVHNGAGYRIEVPSNWNGKLVMWAHGYRGTGLELTVDNHPLRAFLVASGYAWAASSYSKNDYDPAQGAKDTHALTQRFNGLVGKPSHVYITGASMGGHVTGIVAEQWPKSYVGAMPVCGVLGDYELFDFFLDFNVAAQTLSGVGRTFPYGADYLTTTVPATKAGLGPAFPFALNANGQNFKNLVQLRSGGVRPLFEQGWLFWNAVAGDFLFGLGVGNGTLPRAPGFVLQNSDVVYQFDTNPALTAAENLFNQTVQRVTADPQARRNNGIANVPPTTGDLRIPTLTLHTLGDLFVPFHMEQEYARRVAAKGNAHNLVQRATRDYGHCTFTGPELVQTFTDLVKWVELGIKPAGDDVLDPAAVAHPNFGCTYTDKVSPRQWNTVPGLAFLTPPSCPAN
ncbi:MAG: alpha/beta hydrolase [Rubrivivax sp.]|nr:alpha/beta hydrolase [Rubrivivax sp.]